jgi:glutamate/tyrosine decarboxylase-like PLP-dependent enzyme
MQSVRSRFLHERRANLAGQFRRAEQPIVTLASADRHRTALTADPSGAPGALDPEDWEAFGRLAHRALDEALGHLRTVRARPVWTPVPDEVKAALQGPPPLEGEGAERACDQIRRLVLPFATGNIHPRFFGWVHGAGTPGGVLAEIFAAAMNANCGGRDHGAVYVERQVIDWCRRLFAFPEQASGLLVSGTSMATLIALAVARHHMAGRDVRSEGLGELAGRLVGYASSEAHGCVARAFEILGLGAKALRRVPVADDFTIRIDALGRAIAEDRQRGLMPFCVVGTAGTVNTGAIDDLAALAELCTGQDLWLHVDGAFGALAVLSDRLRPALAGIERADSLAFDFHKWLHVPYDAGCVLVRRGEVHRATFAARPGYLASAGRGLAGGEPWFCDFGPELSRGFRALKVWFTLKEHGTRRLGETIAANCDQARHLAERIAAHPRLELLAPVRLNIVCFRVRAPGLAAEALDALNEELVADLQERGIAAPSTTRLSQGLAIRVNITNHRTRTDDLDRLLEAILGLAEERLARAGGGGEAAIGRDAAGTGSVAQALSSPGPAGSGENPFRAPGLIRFAEALSYGERAAILGAASRPELRALTSEVAFAARADLAVPFCATADRITLRAGLMADPAVLAVLVRHALELALWQGLAPDDGQDAALIDLAACRVAGITLRLQSLAERDAAQGALPEWLLAAYEMLATERPIDGRDLAEPEARLLVTKLGRLRGETVEAAPLDRESAHALAAALDGLRNVAAPTERLLVSGGGSRLRVDPVTGFSAHGCAPRPRPEALAFASSTASTVSEQAFAAAEIARQALIGAALRGDGDTFACEMDGVRRDLLAVLGLEGAPVEVVLAPSGTDAEYAALHLARIRTITPIRSIVIAPDETGSGVVMAAGGRHFAAESARGHMVEPGAPLEGVEVERIAVETVEIRTLEGVARPLSEIDAEVERLVEHAVLSGRRCLVHRLHGSKTGLDAPSRHAIRRLRERFCREVDVVVDACQMRLEEEELRGYLDDGCMVLITGSKFHGGPPFSGALLLPEGIARRAPGLDPLPGGLAKVFGRAEWPAALRRIAAGLPEEPNSGVLLRWRAALWEMRAFAAVRKDVRDRIVEKIGRAARDAIEASAWLRPVPADAGDQDFLPTILTFQILRLDEVGVRVPMDLESARRVHRWLNRDISAWLPGELGDESGKIAALACHLGQPVAIGETRTGALRLCIGARMVAEVALGEGLGETLEDRLERQIERARSALSKVELIAEHLGAIVAAAEFGERGRRDVAA